jgi:hypothetical protein
MRSINARKPTFKVITFALIQLAVLAGTAALAQAPGLKILFRNNSQPVTGLC